jgi:EAL domain-containing protein (putative c-di-GMP-specific phosphodiesterase class I)
MERMGLQKALRRALDREEFDVHYQPIIQLATGDLVGLEALVRWHHPERGLIDASEFIETAEEMRLLMGIGEWVLATSAARMQEWQKLSPKPLRLAVNLSTRQFQHRDILRTVESAIRDSGMSPDMLALEISEATAMTNVEMTLDVLKRLSALGTHLWLDDLGTGQSSLRHLKRWPLDRVKIDHSFVRDVPHDASDSAIVSAVIAMAHALDLRVIAEGVETQAQLEFLREQDCEEIQGHLISKPVPADEISAMLKRLVQQSGNPTELRKSTDEKANRGELRAAPRLDIV